MSNLGVINVAGLVGLQTVQIKPQRGMFDFVWPSGSNPIFTKPIIAQAAVEEVGHDELEIVEHPVEQGAMISDHAFKRPTEVVIRYGWSNSPSTAGLIQGLAAGIGQTANIPQSLLAGSAQDQMQAVYQQLLALQVNRVLFSLYTGKRKYVNMLVKSISNQTDERTENALFLNVICRQIIFAVTRTFVLGAAAPADQALPEETSSVVDQGTVQLVDAPNIQNAISGVTSRVQTTVSNLSSGLQSGIDSLESAAQNAVETLNTAATSAANSLPGVMDSLNATMTETASSLEASLAGAAGKLPGIAQDAIDNLNAAIGTVGTPFEIPLVAAPQSLTITIGIPAP